MPGHLLGPHVVGRRVVIRRIVPGATGPTGGPAFVDVLGVCTSWADGMVTVLPDSGQPVAISVADIVSGKPVPPRPSPRLRVSVREAELRTARLWPTVTTTPLGEWALRHEPAPHGRLLKRANSCLTVGDPGVPFEQAAAEIVAFYTERDRRPLAQVEADSDVERAFLGAGWHRLDRGEAAFEVTSIAQLSRALPPATATLAEEGGVPARATATIAAVGLNLARGEAMLDGDWLALHGLAVDPAHRRRGLARAVLAGLVEWGAEHGATTAWLHVETDNQPALALYDSLGFTTHHLCRYLEPGDVTSR